METQSITYAEVNTSLGGENTLPVYHVNNGAVSAYIPEHYVSEDRLAQFEAKLQENWETVAIYVVTGCPDDHIYWAGAEHVGKG